MNSNSMETEEREIISSDLDKKGYSAMKPIHSRNNSLTNRRLNGKKLLLLSSGGGSDSENNIGGIGLGFNGRAGQGIGSFEGSLNSNSTSINSPKSSRFSSLGSSSTYYKRNDNNYSSSSEPSSPPSPVTQFVEIKPLKISTSPSSSSIHRSSYQSRLSYNTQQSFSAPSTESLPNTNNELEDFSEQEEFLQNRIARIRTRTNSTNRSSKSALKPMLLSLRDLQINPRPRRKSISIKPSPRLSTLPTSIPIPIPIPPYLPPSLPPSPSSGSPGSTTPPRPTKSASRISMVRSSSVPTSPHRLSVVSPSSPSRRLSVEPPPTIKIPNLPDFVNVFNNPPPPTPTPTLPLPTPTPTLPLPTPPIPTTPPISSSIPESYIEILTTPTTPKKLKQKEVVVEPSPSSTFASTFESFDKSNYESALDFQLPNSPQPFLSTKIPERSNSIYNTIAIPISKSHSNYPINNLNKSNGRDYVNSWIQNKEIDFEFIQEQEIDSTSFKTAMISQVSLNDELSRVYERDESILKRKKKRELIQKERRDILIASKENYAGQNNFSRKEQEEEEEEEELGQWKKLWKNRKWWIISGLCLLVIIIAVIAGVVAGKLTTTSAGSDCGTLNGLPVAPELVKIAQNATILFPNPRFSEISFSAIIIKYFGTTSTKCSIQLTLVDPLPNLLKFPIRYNWCRAAILYISVMTTSSNNQTALSFVQGLNFGIPTVGNESSYIFIAQGLSFDFLAMNMSSIANVLIR